MGGLRIGEAVRNATDTAQVVIGDGVLGSLDDLFERSFGNRAAVVVADGNTFEVAGETAHRRLAAAGRKLSHPYIFPGQPPLHADYDNVELLIASLRVHDAIPIAVGAGTVNDIVKRAAFECGRRYMSVATAASVDGYTAFGAAITTGGYKQTLPCAAPRAALADLAVLTHAPPAMTSAGYADLLGKVTAGADWIVADALEVEPIDPTPWSLVQGPLREATGRPSAVRAGVPSAIEGLIEGLIMSGLAMQAAASSRPASGAEHQFSHLWEMEGLGAECQPPLSHGFKVGLGAISIAAFYEQLLAHDMTRLDIEAIVRAWPSWEQIERRVRAAHTAPGLQEGAVGESRAKYVDATQLERRLKLLVGRWPKLRDHLRRQLMPAAELRTQLQQAGCPTTPAELGLGRDRLKATYRRAQTIRRRYTVLDLANETALLEPFAEQLFGDRGFWTREIGVGQDG